MNAASKWRPAWAVLASYAPVSARLHLALFYFYGVYYHWAKRATGKLPAELPACSAGTLSNDVISIPSMCCSTCARANGLSCQALLSQAIHTCPF